MATTLGVSTNPRGSVAARAFGTALADGVAVGAGDGRVCRRLVAKPAASHHRARHPACPSRHAVADRVAVWGSPGYAQLRMGWGTSVLD